MEKSKDVHPTKLDLLLKQSKDLKQMKEEFNWIQNDTDLSEACILINNLSQIQNSMHELKIHFDQTENFENYYYETNIVLQNTVKYYLEYVLNKNDNNQLLFLAKKHIDSYNLDLPF